eukprot:jgi/Botrbrau1/17208/Bobra.0817s0004.1
MKGLGIPTETKGIARVHHIFGSRKQIPTCEQTSWERWLLGAHNGYEAARKPGPAEHYACQVFTSQQVLLKCVCISTSSDLQACCCCNYL